MTHSLASADLAQTDFLPNAVGEFAALADRLAGPRAEIEHEFVAMGEDLIGCARLLNETAALYAEMPATLSGPDYDEVVGVLKRVIDCVDLLKADAERTRTFLSDLQGEVSGMVQHVAEVSRILRTLRYLTSTASIIAAALDGGTGDLSSFADQLRGSNSSVEQSVTEFMDSFKSMCASLETASGMNAAFIAHNQKRLDGIVVEASRNLEMMEERRDWATARAAENSERTGHTGVELGSAVGALQIGDSTRQRVEHIEKALQSLDSSDASVAAAVCTLQSAQLSGAVKDFDDQMADLVASLQNLAGDASEMVRTSRADAQDLLADGDAALGAISERLISIASMFADCRRDHTELASAISTVEYTVDEMMANMHILFHLGDVVSISSLNATIKSSKLGSEGSAFQIVALELRELTVRLAETLNEITPRLTGCEASLGAHRDSRVERLESDLEFLSTNLDGTRQQVSDMTERLRDLDAQLATKGAEASDQLASVVRAFSDRPDFCAPWRIAIDELTCLGSERQGVETPSADLEKTLKHLIQNYTMHQEREIHRQIVGDSLGETAPADTKVDESSTDDIFF